MLEYFELRVVSGERRFCDSLLIYELTSEFIPEVVRRS